MSDEDNYVYHKMKWSKQNEEVSIWHWQITNTFEKWQEDGKVE